MRKFDFVVVGGGIAGCWLACLLRRLNFGVLLIESNAIGAGQTIYSQGLIHGGIKYTLGDAVDADASIQPMPARWRSALRGEDKVDLRNTTVVAPHIHLFSTGAIVSRWSARLAALILDAQVAAVTPVPPFDDARFQGSLYRVDDFVVDTASLLSCLLEPLQGRLLRAQVTAIAQDAEGVTLTTDAIEARTIRARYAVLAAGAGNRALMQLTGLDSKLQQHRPLHQVWLRGRLPSLNAHCIDATATIEPRLTVTSTHLPNEMLWSIGGALATLGVGRNRDEQIEKARDELRRCLPWIDVRDCAWSAARIDRIEAQRAGGQRQVREFLQANERILTAWPTKLTLAPALGDRLTDFIETQRLQPADDGAPLLGPAPPLTPPLWETLAWT